MKLRLFNSLSRQVEEFQPLGKTVGMYTCGPTVYDYAHIGNWRAFITADLLKRTLKQNGYSVKHVMNITDIDDKTITGARLAQTPLQNFTRQYEEALLDDLESLNIEHPTLVRATENITEMIFSIEQLLKNGHAYRSEDGVYFDVNQATTYGRFRPNIKPEAVTEEMDGEAKRDPRDFALWKFYKPEDGENKWPAPFGEGKPGWHIECSAMSTKELGETFDIHTGGHDLMFPHHENEIAQSEAISGKLLARYWIHNEFVNVEGEKMSKSLRNIVTLRELKERDISPLAYRYWLLTGHYRSIVNFTWETITGAQTTLNRWYERFMRLGDEIGNTNSEYKNLFFSKINDDLNFPQALPVISHLWQHPDISNADKKATLLEFDKVLGLGLKDQEPIKIPPKIQALVEAREQARADGDWSRSDLIREQIADKGFLIKDTVDGPKLTSKSKP